MLSVTTRHTFCPGMSVSLQRVGAVQQRQRPHAPQPWGENAHRWLRMEDLAPTHLVGQADVRRVVVLEGTGFWACVRVERGSLDWIEVTAHRLVRRQSLGTACFGVLRDQLWFMGPMCRARRCSPEGIPPASVVFVEVTPDPRIPSDSPPGAAARHSRACYSRASGSPIWCPRTATIRGAQGAGWALSAVAGHSPNEGRHIIGPMSLLRTIAAAQLLSTVGGRFLGLGTLRRVPTVDNSAYTL